MKYVIALSAVIFSSTAVFADGIQDYAVITAVHPIYIDRHVDRYETQCYDVEVPVYGYSRSGSSGDVLAGAIIGGVIGNQFGSGSGKDAMTALGVIIGADQALRSRRNEVVSYRIERRCENVRQIVSDPVLSHYSIQYTTNGMTYQTETTRRYTLGQRVEINR